MAVPTRTSTAAGRRRPRLGSSAPVPTSAIGSSGTPNSCAIRIAPLCSGPSVPSVLRVPSGNTRSVEPAPSTVSAPATRLAYPPPVTRSTGTPPVASDNSVRRNAESNQ